ncbi:hypothetical protein AVEN_230647-1 [Araneus ventricosus]|uniref:Uncharacterized protein n=1 Tax=Araneus ventricosus TaxID=182803 RepID=A0A4Y2A1M8_ARAVE|nr:hypothetical protein AVEN_230647-1 [Araneus ventricosus]
MSFLKRARKEDLISLATDLGENPAPTFSKIDLVSLIQGNKHYNEDDAKLMLETAVTEREERLKMTAEQERLKMAAEQERLRALFHLPINRTRLSLSDIGALKIHKYTLCAFHLPILSYPIRRYRYPDNFYRKAVVFPFASVRHFPVV